MLQFQKLINPSPFILTPIRNIRKNIQEHFRISLTSKIGVTFGNQYALQGYINYEIMQLCAYEKVGQMRRRKKTSDARGTKYHQVFLT